LCCLFFFFSSRRRHTRFSRDWSSDVCSSDLARQPTGVRSLNIRREAQPSFHPSRNGVGSPSLKLSSSVSVGAASNRNPSSSPVRSEERRVGKECRGRGAPDEEQRKRR